MNETQIARWSPARGRALDLAGCRVLTIIGCFACVPFFGVVLMFLEYARVSREFFYLALAVPIAIAFAPTIFRAFRSRSEMRHFDADSNEVAVEVVVSLAASGAGAWTWGLGRDEGMLCLESGWLVFRGRRSEWSVRATPGKSIDEKGFRFRPPGESECEVAFVELDDVGRVRALIAEWIRAPVPSGLEMLPPVTAAPGSDRSVPPWTWAIPSAVGVLLSLVYSVFGYADMTGLTFGFIFLLALVGTLTAARIRLADLRRAGAIE